MRKNVKKDSRFVQFGESIYSARKSMGLTQEKLAERSGLSVHSVGRAERGETVSHKTIEALGKALHITFDRQVCSGIRTCPEAHLCHKEIVEYLVKLPDSKDIK